jgi:hypothetical protein
MKKMLVHAIVAGVVAYAAGRPVEATELITNGGFETGTYAGWSLVEPNGFSNVGFLPQFAHTGTHHANLAPAIGAVGSLSQTVMTNAGEALTLSFWLANFNGAPVNSFEVFFGGDLLDTLASPPFTADGVYRQSSYALLGTGGAMTLEFRYRHDADFWLLDDVSLSSRPASVPEPGSWSMLLLGLGALALVRRTKGAVRAACA